MNELVFNCKMAEIIKKDLKKRIDKGEHPMVPGIVGKVEDRLIGYVYLYNNVSIWGEVSKYSWRKGRTSQFPEACKENYIYNFYVTEYTDVKLEDGGEETIFELSRVDLEKSWQEVNEMNGIEIGKELTVRCVYIPDASFRKRDCFGSVSDEIDGLEVLVSVPEENAEQIRVGEYYKCKVAKIDNAASVVYATLKPEEKSVTENLFKFPWED